jgi:calcineurin-like phosphoesterase family protein
MIWITSDTHAFHKNISGPEVSEWKTGYRDFKDQYQMTVKIAETFNKYVKEDDVLYHLGDWSFGGKDKIFKFRALLNVKTIYLCYGNHDNNIRRNVFLKTNDEKGDVITAQSLFTSTQDVIWSKIGDSEFFLSHYSHRIWPGSHKGVIHLYGHSHGSIPDYGKSMDVGVDVAYRMFGEYRPFNITEIIDIMKKKKIELPDHHNEKTNIK